MELLPPCWSGLVLLAVPLLADGEVPALPGCKQEQSLCHLPQKRLLAARAQVFRPQGETEAAR